MMSLCSLVLFKKMQFAIGSCTGLFYKEGQRPWQ
jgi:hypothetical protein